MFAILLLTTALLCPSHATLQNGAAAWDKILPTGRIMERFNTIRKILLPVPEDQLEEGLYHIGSYYIPLDAETELCRNHSNRYFESFLNKELWAMRMMDSGSKVPAGILDGHIMDMGSYDECMTSEESEGRFRVMDSGSKVPAGILDGHIMDLGSYDECMTSEEPEGRFRGKFCIVETRGVLPEDLTDRINPKERFVETIRSDFGFAVCVPSSCTHTDVKAHMDVALNSVNATAIIYPYSCSSALPEPYTLGDRVAIFFVVLIAALTVLSTIYDYRCKESERSGLLAAWSLSANIRQMVDTSTTTAAITCMNGLRVVAILWVIVGHRTLHLLAFPSLRNRSVPEKIDLLAMAPVENTQLAVEIFFLMTGLLVSYSFLRYQNKGNKFNVVHFYVYRYLRLTPTLASMVLLQATILRRITDGPLWHRLFHSYQRNCQQYWWSTLLYIANYTNPQTMCVPQAWYLCSDFQLYVLSPLVLLPLWRRPRLGLSIAAGLAVLSTAAALANAYIEKLPAGGAVTLDRRTEPNHIKDYIVTHFRAFSFFLGLALGYLLFLIKEGKLIIKLKKWMLWVGWIVSIFFILFSIFFVNYFLAPSYKYDPLVDILYLIFHRHMLALGFAWIILVCTLGHGGFVDKFLSWRAWIPLARLTFGAYLTHVFIQNSQTGSQRSSSSLHHIYVIYYHSAADTVLSFLSAALLYLAIEAPSANITSWCFQGKKKTADDQEITKNAIPIFKYKSAL